VVFLGEIRVLRCKGDSIISPYFDNPRIYVYLKNRIISLANLRFYFRDATTMEASAVVSGCRRTIRSSSVYLPCEDPDPPSAMMRGIVQPSAEEKKEIIQRIDVNAHHTLWGSTDINPRGESLMNIW
jgi:hypothetical protein